MLKNFLGFGCMHENNFFKKVEIDLKDFFWNFFNLNFFLKTEYFNTGFVFYSVNIQTDIMQN